jgi:hypothetical protein
VGSARAVRPPGRWPGRRSLVVGLVLLVTAMPAGCGLPTVKSQWLGHPAAVDGDLAKWQGSLYSLADGQVYLGVRNDRSDLYLCLATSSANLERQFVRSGVTCWIDPQGGTNKALGLRFPARSAEAGPPAGQRRRWFSPEAAIKALGDSAAELEILHGEGPGTRLRLDRAKGIALKADYRDEMLVYELRIALSGETGAALAAQAQPGGWIGLGFETPKIVPGGPMGREGAPGMGPGEGSGGTPDEEGGPEEGGGPDQGSGGSGQGPGGGGWDRPGGGSGGPGSGGPPGGMMRGSRGSGGRPSAPEALEVWVRVLLAGGEG